MKTLVILNPNAGGGRAYSIFKKIEDNLIETFGNLAVALSKTAEEVAETLKNRNSFFFCILCRRKHFP